MSPTLNPAQSKPPETIAFDRFVLDLRRRVLLASGETVDLQSRAFDILALLVARRDRVVGREEIMAEVWQGQIVADSNLTVQMSILRRALADCGASLVIITVPGRGYRFVGNVCESSQPAAPSAEAGSAAKVALPGLLVRRGRLIAGILGGAALVLAGAVTWRILAAPPLKLNALVKVTAEPDEIRIDAGRLRPVDYVFTIQNQVDLQLETEDFGFYLPSGEPVGVAIHGGRIWGGSFPLHGGTTSIYHNNIYLPPAVAAAGKARGSGLVLLKHVFHLRDARGNEMTVPAVLMVGVGP